jgi:hypothetical protein
MFYVDALTTEMGSWGGVVLAAPNTIGILFLSSVPFSESLKFLVGLAKVHHSLFWNYEPIFSLRQM